jgi:nucleotide-binding universal stress UspA family protein
VRLLERDLRHEARSLMGTREPRMRFRAAWHGAGDAIAEDARQLGADAMVIGVPLHKRGTLTGLKAATVLRSASVPVFCIPEPRHPQARQIPKIGSVLIACDLSDASVAAVVPTYGLLLGGGRAELLYAHVRGPGNAIESPTLPALTEDERASIAARLRAATPPEASEHGIATHISVVEGNLAAEAILQAAERLDVDVIAVGSHGRSGLKRAVLGSGAEDVAHRSPRPVLIVRGLAP